MAFRRAVVPNAQTSTKLLGRSAASVTRSNSRLTHAALLHGSRAGSEATRLAAARFDSKRGFASAMPAAEEGGEATGRGQKSTGKFFRPVEKLANGVAIIR